MSLVGRLPLSQRVEVLLLLIQHYSHSLTLQSTILLSIFVITVGLALFMLDSDVMELEVIGVVRIYLELLLPPHQLERDVTIQLDTRDGTATGNHML